MKTTAAEFSRFLLEGWPTPSDDWYMDDLNNTLWEETFKNNDDYKPNYPNQVIKVEDFDAAVLYQGTDPKKKGEIKSLAALSKIWQKSQKSMTLTIRFPKTEEAKVRAILNREKLAVI